ncbi:MAG: hypothetical protein ABEL76_08610, partial [Bradymonadaceae bacterium]
LERLIRMEDDHLSDFFGHFMSWALELYLQFKEGAETVNPYLTESEGAASDPQALMRMFLASSPLDWNGTPPWRSESPGDERQASRTEDPSSNGADATTGDANAPEDVAALRDEIDELRQKIDELTDDRQ